MWRRYAGAALIVQAVVLAGCDSEQATPNAASDRPVPALDPSLVPVAGPERVVLAFGDSLYAGYGLAEGESLPDLLEADLRAGGMNATVVNAGVSGDTTAAGRQRFAFALDSLQRAPDLILLGLGGNDVLRQIPPQETRANLTAILELAKERGIPVVLTGMQAPPNLGPDYSARFNAIWPELAERYGAALDPFILDGVIGRRTLMQADFIHPTAEGIVIIAERLAPIVVRKLEAQSVG